MAVTGRAVVCIILTLIVYLITWQFHNWPVFSSVFAIKMISYTISGVLIMIAFWQYTKLSAYQTRAQMAENPASFRPEKLDCYVAFQGILTEENKNTLPISGKACAFYQTEVFAEWVTQKKKPAKGPETQRKPLLRKQTTGYLELLAGDQRVYVQVEDFNRGEVQLQISEKVQSECPSPISSLAQNKYQTYQITEGFACKGDTITAQGKLTRHMDGRLVIKPTRLLKFPSFLSVQAQRANGNQLAREIADQALKNARLKQVNIAALVINALLTLHVSFTQVS